MMKRTSLSIATLIAASFVVFAGGCVMPEHRMDTAATRDADRRAAFDRCRAEGHTDCDAILNAPVNSNTPPGDSVRDQERRTAYNRCVERNGTDCDDLLRR